MPLPAWLPRSPFSRAFNRLARHLPKYPYSPIAVVLHEGRKSGKRHETPVLAFRSESGFAISLPYGRDTDWVKNVLAADGCRLAFRGKQLSLTHPRTIQGPHTRRLFPAPVRAGLWLLRVDQAMLLDEDGNP